MTQTYRISRGSGPSRLFAGVVSVLVLAFGLLALNYGLQLRLIPGDGGITIVDPPPATDDPQKTDEPQIPDPTTGASDQTVYVPQPDWEGADEGNTDGTISGSSAIPAAPVSIARPVYPSSSIDNCEQGKVGLMLRIGEDGRVTDAVVTSSSGYPALDDAALRAAKSWRFKPAIVNGVAVESTLNKTIRFDLKNEVGGAITQAQLRECLKGQ